MKDINIWFTDFLPKTDIRHTNEYKWLSKKYNLILNPKNPDFVISSVFGLEHLKYDKAVRILVSGENISPDFNVFDYAITSDPIELGDRHLRVPYWALRYLSEDHFEYERRPVADETLLVKRKFCNFLYSNSSSLCAMPYRNELFKKLSSYKHVDSGGSCLNNMAGVRVKDKMEFIGKYKFTIACENSIKVGYSTEKILDPLIANSVPIYLGDPCIIGEFNPKAFINVADFSNADDMVSFVKNIDCNDSEYLRILKEPIFLSDKNLLLDYHKALYDFLMHVFDQQVNDARRRCEYGWTRIHVARQAGLCKSLDKRIITSISGRLAIIRNVFRRNILPPNEV